MKQKHTRGTWVVDKASAHPGSWRVRAGDTTIVEFGTLANYSEWEANARLIAAAPELLAACEWAIGIVEATPDAKRCLPGNYTATLRAAIQAARGEPKQ